MTHPIQETQEILRLQSSAERTLRQLLADTFDSYTNVDWQSLNPEDLRRAGALVSTLFDCANRLVGGDTSLSPRATLDEASTDNSIHPPLEPEESERQIDHDNVTGQQTQSQSSSTELDGLVLSAQESIGRKIKIDRPQGVYRATWDRLTWLLCNPAVEPDVWYAPGQLLALDADGMVFPVGVSRNAILTATLKVAGFEHNHKKALGSRVRITKERFDELVGLSEVSQELISSGESDFLES